MNDESKDLVRISGKRTADSVSAGDPRRQPGIPGHRPEEHSLLGGVQQQQVYRTGYYCTVQVYNNNRDLAEFLIRSGARVRPWSWLQPSHLPEPLRYAVTKLSYKLSQLS